jgi:DNA replication licensing factor MCM2
MAKREISRRFTQFLLTYVDDKGRNVYKEEIKKMCDNNLQSLAVSYMHLSIAQPTFGMWVADAPELMLEELNTTAMEVVKQLYPDYDEIHNEIFVRIVERRCYPPHRHLPAAQDGHV